MNATKNHSSTSTASQGSSAKKPLQYAEQVKAQLHGHTPENDEELIKKMKPQVVADILRQHRNHSSDLFDNRLNAFLVIESVLLGIVGILYNQPVATILFPKIVVILGLFITLVCWYVQARQKYILTKLTDELLAVDPVFRRTLRYRKHGKGRYWVSATKILAHAVPMLLAVMWVLLLIFL